ncbi:hypothetical protein BOX15_Mlig032268g1 [Macrostomum lignano]|uniref:Uncharacterized protein n=3 Tax=Macrostomum lignano TaxID=282301 RepID=A0A267FDP4_9PLAT|nr:hypothetical protein BOX15_Mlig032268g1 [Macrostomum lignano]
MDFSNINVPGLISVIIFYLLILVVGIWAGRKSKGRGDSEDVMVAGRNIGLVVGIFTMTATWVGGGYINGTAEIVFNPAYGLVWALAPFGYALSLVLGGIFFAAKMRTQGYVTMLDPFQYKYGERMCGLLFVPALLGEVFWSAAILSALGATLEVILSMGSTESVIVSACIALGYTLFGGLYSVAYTDVVQLFCIFFGLWLSVPFAMTSSYTQPILSTAVQRVWNGTEQFGWLGKLDPLDGANYADNLLMLTFGGIPWQVYFQRVLSAKSAKKAQVLSYVAAFGCLLMAVPSVLIGAVAASADWEATGFLNKTEGQFAEKEMKLILPLVLQYLCPPVVSFLGLGVVSAAVMSSADSSILSAASMFARNVMKPIFWQQATDRQIIWSMRVAIAVIGAIACVLAIKITTIYGLWFLCSDLVFVILFPQLLNVIYIKKSNTYGSLAGYLVGLFCRLTAGETLLFLPPLFRYPGFVDGEGFYQRFPVKTLSMLLSLAACVGVSYFTDWLFHTGRLQKHHDVFRCVVNVAPAEVEESQGEMLSISKLNLSPNSRTGKTFELDVPQSSGRAAAAAAAADSEGADAKPIAEAEAEEKAPLSNHN